MDKIIKDITMRYKDNIGKIRTKFNNKIMKLTGGSLDIQTPINLMSGIKQMSDIDEQLKNINRLLLDMDEQLDPLVKQIDELDDIQITDTTSVKGKKLTDRIDTFIKDVNRRISSHTFEGTISDSELYSTKENDVEKFKSALMESFMIIIENYRNTMSEMKGKPESDVWRLIKGEVQKQHANIKTFILSMQSIRSNIRTIIDQMQDVTNPNISIHDIAKYPKDAETPIYVETIEYKNLKTSLPIDIIDNRRFEDFYRSIENAIDNTAIESVVANNIGKIKKALDDINSIGDISSNQIENIIDLDKSIQKSKSDVAIQLGGRLDISLHNEISESLLILVNEISKAGEHVGDIYDNLERIKQLHTRFNNYLIYLVYIGTAHERLNFIVRHKYINRGILQYYKAIMADILIEFTSNKPRIDTLYFNRYHYFTLKLMFNFVDFMIRNMEPMDIIDIERCDARVRLLFNIFDHFKDLLDSYNEVLKDKRVKIYSRINDWGRTIQQTDEMFSGNPYDLRYMIVKPQLCKYLPGISNEDNLKFTEVFADQIFNDNTNISKYMLLDTQLAKQKGVMLTTYGYSGTGKTYTLFGQGATPGILQATLRSIRGLKGVNFRIYEIYGLGVQYPHYWQKSDISMEIIPYNLKLSDNNMINLTRLDSRTDISTYVSGSEDYLTVSMDRVIPVFKNFSDIISELDVIRKREGRIKMTPNNPESSRSIIVYEFQNLIGDNFVPLVIIDLPGREEIVETYVDHYLSRSFIKELEKMGKNYNTPFYRALLSSLAINPLYLAILDPGVIFRTFNELEEPLRRELTGPMNQTTQIQDNIVIDADMHDDETGIRTDIEQATETLTYEDENLGYLRTGRPIKLSYAYNFDKLWANTRKFNMEGDRLIIKGADGVDPKPTNKKQIPVEDNSIQYQGVLAIHLLNRIILMNRFDVMKKIGENIISKYFRTDFHAIVNKLNTIEAKIDFLQEYLGDRDIEKVIDRYIKFAGEQRLKSARLPDIASKLRFMRENVKDKIADLDAELKQIVEDIVYYSYFLTPYEGIFINENIVGVIKVLAKDIMNKSDQYVMKNLLDIQDQSLDFKKQKMKIREYNYKLYAKDRHNTDFEPFENIYRSTAILDEMYKNNKGIYTSKNIFLYDKPSIGDVLNRFVKERQYRGRKIIPITDYKLFYLFNNTQEEKCGHQYSLLKNTEALIKAVENPFDDD